MGIDWASLTQEDLDAARSEQERRNEEVLALSFFRSMLKSAQFKWAVERGYVSVTELGQAVFLGLVEKPFG